MENYEKGETKEVDEGPAFDLAEGTICLRTWTSADPHRSMMENYEKGETKEVDEEPAFNLAEGTICMRVSSGSKLRNLMGFAVTKMKEQATRQICWSGTGNAVTKTITCTEIVKRKFKGLHQITKVRYHRVEEYWEPKVEGLERLKVNKDIPAISILLSKDPLDKTEPGYQGPGPIEDILFGGDKSQGSNAKTAKPHRRPKSSRGDNKPGRGEQEGGSRGSRRGRGGGRNGGARSGAGNTRTDNSSGARSGAGNTRNDNRAGSEGSSAR